MQNKQEKLWSLAVPIHQFGRKGAALCLNSRHSSVHWRSLAEVGSQGSPYLAFFRGRSTTYWCHFWATSPLSLQHRLPYGLFHAQRHRQHPGVGRQSVSPIGCFFAEVHKRNGLNLRSSDLFSYHWSWENAETVSQNQEIDFFYLFFQWLMYQKNFYFLKLGTFYY